MEAGTGIAPLALDSPSLAGSEPRRTWVGSMEEAFPRISPGLVSAHVNLPHSVGELDSPSHDGEAPRTLPPSAPSDWLPLGGGTVPKAARGWSAVVKTNVQPRSTVAPVGPSLLTAGFARKAAPAPPKIAPGNASEEEEMLRHAIQLSLAEASAGPMEFLEQV